MNVCFWSHLRTWARYCHSRRFHPLWRHDARDCARLAAAKMILDLSRESDIEQRLAALEEQLEGKPSYESTNAIN